VVVWEVVVPGIVTATPGGGLQEFAISSALIQAGQMTVVIALSIHHMSIPMAILHGFRNLVPLKAPDSLPRTRAVVRPVIYMADRSNGMLRKVCMSADATITSLVAPVGINALQKIPTKVVGVCRHGTVLHS